MSLLFLKNHYFIDGLGLVPRVKSLTRDTVNKRWRINGTNDNEGFWMYFPDSIYGTVASGYKAAVKMIRKISEILKPKTQTVIKEKSTKRVPLNCPGVMLRSERSNRTTNFYFYVHDPVNRVFESIKIGNELDVMDNWDSALRAARAVRYSFLCKKKKKAQLDPKDKDIVLSF